MDSAAITRKEMDALLAFLPAFDDPGREFTIRWAEQTAEEKHGALSQPFPVYCEDVLAFFSLAGQPCWCDYAYDPPQAGQMLWDADLIARATLDEIKTLLTFCVRGERFMDGHWENMLKSGKVVSILKRLAVLRELN